MDTWEGWGPLLLRMDDDCGHVSDPLLDALPPLHHRLKLHTGRMSLTRVQRARAWDGKILGGAT